MLKPKQSEGLLFQNDCNILGAIILETHTIDLSGIGWIKKNYHSKTENLR